MFASDPVPEQAGPAEAEGRQVRHLLILPGIQVNSSNHIRV